MAQLKMEINLKRCVGCGTCAIACKIGNNTRKRGYGQTYNKADFITETTGAFPYAKWTALPVMCNHCENPKCVAICPVSSKWDPNCVGGQRKAMYKLKDDKGGLVLHDDSRCYGCGRCQRACPYSTLDVDTANAQFSVISLGIRNLDLFAYMNSGDQAITDGTASWNEVRSAVGMSDLAPAYKNSWTYTDVCSVAQNDLRPINVADKCYLCVHRHQYDTNGSLPPQDPSDSGYDESKVPYCALACPAQARKLVVTSIPSDASVLAQKQYTYLRKVKLVNRSTITGASIPNIYYVNSFSNR